GGDDHVGDPGEHEPARDAGALHRSDHRIRDLAPASAHPEIHLGLACGPLATAGLVGVVPPEHGAVVVVGVGVPAGGADIVPGGEVFTGTGEYDDVDVVVVDGPAERGIQRVGHRRVLRVTIVGPVHG